MPISYNDDHYIINVFLELVVKQLIIEILKKKWFVIIISSH